MPREVTRSEILDWLTTHGGSAEDAVTAFWPAAAPTERKRHLAAVRQWVHRARKGAIPAPAAVSESTPLPPGRPPAGGSPGGVPRRAPTSDELPTWEEDPSVVSESLAADLESLAARLAGDARCLRATHRWDQASRVEAVILDVRQQIEAARKAAASRVRVERTPAAIASEIERHRRTIELAAEQARRKAARALAEASAARDRTL